MTESLQEKPRVSPIRSFAAGAIGAASILLPVAAGVEAFADTPNLAEQSEEAGRAANYLEYKYKGLVGSYEKDLEFEQDEKSGRLSVTLNRDPDLTIEPIKEAFDSLDDTTNDVARLKWLTIGGAVGLISAAAIGRWDRSMGKEGTSRETYLDMSDEFRGCFLGLMLFAGIPTVTMFLAEGNLQKDIGKIKAFDLDRAAEVSDSMQADLEKLDIHIQQNDSSTKVSFNPDSEALKSLEAKSGELSTMMPDISDQDMALDQFMLSFAGLALIGTAGSIGTVASSVGRLKRGEKRSKRLSTEQRALVDLENRRTRPRFASNPRRDYPRARR